jgi:hypothetical protein
MKLQKKGTYVFFRLWMQSLSLLSPQEKRSMSKDLTFASINEASLDISTFSSGFGSVHPQTDMNNKNKNG